MQLKISDRAMNILSARLEHKVDSKTGPFDCAKVVEGSEFGKSYDPARTRTLNLRFRRPTPYPLGHRAGQSFKNKFNTADKWTFYLLGHLM